MTFILIQVLIFLAVYWLFRPVGGGKRPHLRWRRPVARRLHRTAPDARYRQVVADHHAATARIDAETSRIRADEPADRDWW